MVIWCCTAVLDLGVLVIGCCNLYFMESLHWIEVVLEYVGIKLGSDYTQVTLFVFYVSDKIGNYFYSMDFKVSSYLFTKLSIEHLIIFL